MVVDEGLGVSGDGPAAERSEEELAGEWVPGKAFRVEIWEMEMDFMGFCIME